MDFEKMKSCYVQYRASLSGFRERVKQSRLWFKQQQTEYKSVTEAGAGRPKSHSGHIFNAIQYKHADLMDNYPAANILPREPKDEESAKVLTEIVPFILERCAFKRTYDLNLYNKLISGTAAYGVFFNPDAEGGRGDIEVKDVELLNLTWQPDAVSLSESKYIFYDTFMDAEDFSAVYGSLEGVCTQAQYDEQKELASEDVCRTVVITDVYYKKRNADNRRVLHFARFSGNHVLFSSEDEGEQFQNGFYGHGEYPFIFDLMNPVPGELTGMGIVDVAKDMQAYIDRLDEAINRKCLICAQDRYFFSENSGVNEDEFLDVSRPLVHVRGSLDEGRAQPLNVTQLPHYIVEHRNNKIAELKEIVGNRDFSQGGTAGGVTAASAITALQTASDKLVRDNVTFSYIAFEKIVRLVVELIREFYDEPRIFRVVGDDGRNEYRSVSSTELFAGGEQSIFDISLSVEKNNPYSRAAHNQLILELNNAGLLNPDNFENASFILKNLNFDGKDKLIRDLEELSARRKQQMAAVRQVEDMQKGRTSAVPQAGGKPQGEENSPLVEIPIVNENSNAGSSQEPISEQGALIEIPLG